MDAVVFTEVWKLYGRTEALRGASFRIPRGVLAGVVGPNGSGKTTSFRLALGLARPTRGSVEVLGADPWVDEEIRAGIGYLPEKPLYPPDVSVERFLLHSARLRGLRSPAEEARRAARLAGVAGYMDKPIGALSRGYLQRLGLAYAFLGSPVLLFLDEPTANLDPVARVEILDLIKTVGEDLGATVVISTHILPEMERVANYLVALAWGRVVDQGPLSELASRYGAETVFYVRVRPGEERRVAARLIMEEPVKAVEVREEGVVLARSQAGMHGDAERLIESLAEEGLVVDYMVEKASLEQLYRAMIAG